MKRFRIIACDVLQRELTRLAALSPHYTDLVFLYQGLHNTPDLLRAEVQRVIDETENGFPYNHSGTAPSYDMILLVYGLCSNGLSGIRAGSIPLVLPKAHDCITLLLGSKERYRKEFDENPGTYWYSSGWIERGWQPSEQKYKALELEFLEKYGEDNAEWLVEQELASLRSYKRTAFIRMPEVGRQDELEQFTKNSADYLEMAYERLEGDDGILKRMLDGDFHENEVILVQPGQYISPSFDAEVVLAVDSEEDVATD